MKSLFALIVTSLVFGSAVCFGEQESKKETKSLDDCISIGIENYKPLKLADEEIELARLKKEEAQRTFFPAFSLKAEETKGEASNSNASPDFTEQNYGASVSHPLFGGGKIMGTYRQAEASFKASEKSREKTFHDFVYGVREAYWNLVGAQKNLDERELVRNLIREDLNKITEQYVLDLAVKQQFLAVKAQYLKANTQLNEAKRRYSKQKWNLAKALGLPTPPKFDVTQKIPFKKLEVELEKCLTLAATHRPDLALQDHLVEIAKGGYKVATAHHKPRLNLNGFYGRSAAAFDSQDLDFREDWQVNVKLTQAFLGNSVDVNGAAINTSPKLGQSSRTETKTKGVQLNILDGMKNRTDIKKADLSFRQAQLKRDDLRRDVAIDVEEAYFNFNQALLQIEFSEEDTKLAEEELRVAESKKKYGLSGVLEVAQARNRLADSRGAQVQSLTDYQVAIAALNRSVGILDQFKTK